MAEQSPLISAGHRTPHEPYGIANIHVGLPLMFRWKGTVILNTWWQVLLVLIYTAIVVFVHFNETGFNLDIPQALIDILGIVTGLLLAFRTQTAYERYTEGRLLWSQMTLNIRNLTRYFWVGSTVHDSKTIVEKKSAINLLLAFAVATKHYLREEYSYDFEDLRDLIANIKSFHIPSSNVPISYQQQQQRESQDNHNNNHAHAAHAHGFDIIKDFIRDHFKAQALMTPTNIPIELSYYIESYINNCQKRGKCSENTINSMRAGEALSNLVECLTAFERILRTPIPLAYSVHLHHMTWLYILALPYQLVEELGWWTVAIVGIAAFSFIGILEISWEIENPFGYEDNDLPLDDFCKVIAKEIERTIMRAPMEAEEWIYDERNCPFVPKSKLLATELCELPEKEIMRLIHRSSTSTNLEKHFYNSV